MPLYEYECRLCRHRFEQKHGFDDPPPAACPQCGGEVYRLFRPVPIIYKGGGFYSTDHRPTSWSGEESKETKETKEKTKDTPEKATAKEK